MARGRHSRGVDWYVISMRAILPLDTFHCSRSLARVVRRRIFEVRYDTAFEEVILGCAALRPGQENTWINDDIIDAYVELNRRGITHSVEAWRAGNLVGGLYGVALGAAFFAESMFHRSEIGGTNASKVCVHHLVERLRHRQFELLDLQMPTPATLQFGVVEIPAAEFNSRLARALDSPPRW